MKRLWPLIFLLLTLLAPARAEGGFVYLLPAGDTLYPGEDFTVDYMVSVGGRMQVTLLDEAGSATTQWRIQCKKDTVRMFRWDGKAKGKPIPAGRYTLSFKLTETGESLVLPLTIAGAAWEKAPVAPTGPGGFLPADGSAAALQQALAAPLAVADIGPLQHQALYARPSTSSQSVGEVHGQTQGLNILRIEGDYALAGAYRHADGAYVEGYVPLKKLKMIQPHPRYGLVCDKNAQTLTLYENGEALAVLPVSTGLMAKDKLFRETHAGAFVLEARVAAFRQGGYQYPYCIRYSGGNLLHSIGFRYKNGRMDFSEQQQALGQKASHGCIRVGESGGYDARWLWENLPRGTKLLILDDQSRRESEMAALLSGTGRLAPASPPPGERPQKAAPPPVSTDILLTFGGDCVLGSDRGDHQKPESFDAVIAQKGLSWPFFNLLPLIRNDDLTLFNLEVVLQADDAGYQKRQHNFRGDPGYAAMLTASSVEAVNVANNHHIDYTAPGKKSTVAALAAAGVRYSGYGHLDVYEKDGVKIGFAGIRETVYRQKPKQMEEDIAALIAQGCHVIVYSAHFGQEYAPRHNALQETIAHRAIDLGADIVVGTHPHVVQGVERYRGGLIFYSLGNLVFGGNLQLTEFDAMLAQVKLTVQNGALLPPAWTLVPVLTSGARPANDFRPVIAQGADKERILQKVAADGGLPQP